MVWNANLADIVKESAEKENLGRGEGEKEGMMLLLEEMEGGHGLEEMVIDGVDVVDIVLGQGDKPGEFREIGPEEPGFEHRFQNRRRLLRLLEDGEKALADGPRVTEAVVDQRQLGLDALAAPVVDGESGFGHLHEDPHQELRPFGQESGLGKMEAPPMLLDPRLQHPFAFARGRRRVAGGVTQDLVHMLEEEIGGNRHRPHMAVNLTHEVLDRQDPLLVFTGENLG